VSRRATWRLYVDAVGHDVLNRLHRMPDKQLKAMLRSFERVPPSSTNCWCVSYELAPIIKDLAEDTLRLRRVQRKRMAKEKQPFDAQRVVNKLLTPVW
jgi:hypothetical protein